MLPESWLLCNLRLSVGCRFAASVIIDRKLFEVANPDGPRPGLGMDLTR